MNQFSAKKYTPALQHLKNISDPWEAFEILQQNIGDASWPGEVRRLLNCDEKPPPEVYEKLSSLAFKGMVSLNLDDFAQRALGEVLGTSVDAVFGDDRGRLEKLIDSRPFLYQPHGNINVDSSWVLTKSKFETLLQDGVHKAFLQAMFTTARVVFLGINAKDEGASRRLMELSEIGATPNRHFWIASDSHVVDRAWAENAGVRQILYPSQLGDSNMLMAIIERLAQATSAEDVIVRRPVLGKHQHAPSNTEAIQDLWRLDDIDEIRLQLTALIANLRDESGKIDPADYAKFCREHARAINTAFMLPDRDDPDARWFGYRITGDMLGGKTVGRVYPGKREDEKLVAIKLLEERRHTDEMYLSAFRRGVESLRILNSNNISGVVEVIDAYEVPPTIVMPLENCVSLKDFLQAQNPPPPDVIKILTEASKILEQAHMLPEIVLHRDLRPSNILLVDYDWQDLSTATIKLIDFDLSWYKGAIGDDFIRTDHATIGFQAPEQLDPSPSANRRTVYTDSFGLAATIYACMAKAPPPSNASQLKDWSKTVRRVVQRFLRDIPELIVPVWRVVVHAMKPEIGDRVSVSTIRRVLENSQAWLEGRITDITDAFLCEVFVGHLSDQDYSWSDREGFFEFNSPSGFTVRCELLFDKGTISCVINYEKPKNAEHARVTKILSRLNSSFVSDMQQTEGVLADFSFPDSYAFSAKVSIPVPTLKAEFPKLSGQLKEVLRKLRFE